jgi:hypothetical protein
MLDLAEPAHEQRSEPAWNPVGHDEVEAFSLSDPREER